jgi:aryl-alcohol dehydrogenase-like predicted oxidoreductase
VIARTPFDEGSLTGALTSNSAWPADDFRHGYFSQENLAATLPKVEAVRADLPEGMALPELALRFILHHPAVSTVIPGMRKLAHVDRNLAVSDGAALPAERLLALRAHRWDRRPKVA